MHGYTIREFKDSNWLIEVTCDDSRSIRRLEFYAENIFNGSGQVSKNFLIMQKVVLAFKIIRIPSVKDIDERTKIKDEPKLAFK